MRPRSAPRAVSCRPIRVKRRWCWWTGSAARRGLRARCAAPSRAPRAACVCNWRRRPLTPWSHGSIPWIGAMVLRLNRSRWIARRRREWSMPASRSPRPGIELKRRPRRWPLILLGVIALAAALVFVLPASVISHFLPAQVHAEDFSGTLVHGAAGRLSVNAREAGAIEWRLHPLSLLRMALVVDIHWVKVGFVIDGTVEFAGRAVAGHNIQGGGPIEDLHDLGLADGWNGTPHLTI